MKKWLVIGLLALAAGLAVRTLRERAPAPSPVEEIDEASQEALREILRQEDE